MHTDPIADLITRIRNASRARKEQTTVPYSQMKENILKEIKLRNFITDYSVEQKEKFKTLIITFDEKRQDISLKRISKPGQRIYIKSSEIKKINGGLGVSIISTPHGIISGEEAKKLNIGGELICEIY
jgi:small subunit ribosomal protein S8